jgi:hypothetical protein
VFLLVTIGTGKKHTVVVLFDNMTYIVLIDSRHSLLGIYNSTQHNNVSRYDYRLYGYSSARMDLSSSVASEASIHRVSLLFQVEYI